MTNETETRQAPAETGVWYCPVCGYVDPATRDLYCPKQHPAGVKRPRFREIHRGYYVRVGIAEGHHPDAEDIDGA